MQVHAKDLMRKLKRYIMYIIPCILLIAYIKKPQIHTNQLLQTKILSLNQQYKYFRQAKPQLFAKGSEERTIIYLLVASTLNQTMISQRLLKNINIKRISASALPRLILKRSKYQIGYVEEILNNSHCDIINEQKGIALADCSI